MAPRRMFRRKIYDHMLEWKRGEGSTALLIEGARHVGKTTVVREFARNEYRSHILIDFSVCDDDIKGLIDTYSRGADRFFQRLQELTGTELHTRQSLIVFDEVQLYPRARQLIKHLVEDGRYDYIETGSLISIKENVEDILIPSEEESMDMHPMDFEEFLWAQGNEATADFLREDFKAMEPLGLATHRRILDMYGDIEMDGPAKGEWSRHIGEDITDPKAAPEAAFGQFGDEYVKNSKKHYYASVTFVDEQVGRIIRALKDKGMYDDAVICFVSDHGDMMGDHNHWRKTYAYEGSAAIPFIVKLPESIYGEHGKGTVSDLPVELRDILPTFLDAAGGTVPEDMDGMSLLPLIKGKNTEWRRWILVSSVPAGSSCLTSLPTLRKAPTCLQTADTGKNSKSYARQWRNIFPNAEKAGSKTESLS